MADGTGPAAFPEADDNGECNHAIRPVTAQQPVDSRPQRGLGGRANRPVHIDQALRGVFYDSVRHAGPGGRGSGRLESPDEGGGSNDGTEAPTDGYPALGVLLQPVPGTGKQQLS